MKYQYTKLFIAICIVLSSTAQLSASCWKGMLKCADKKAGKKYYLSATQLYERVLHSKSLPPDSIYGVKKRQADCYLKMENTLKAAQLYNEVITAGKGDAMTTFNYARSQQANGNYELAKRSFESIANDKTLANRDVSGFVAICDKGMQTVHKNKFGIHRMPFNTPASEYAPALCRGGLIITSNASQMGGTNHRIQWNGEAFTHLYAVSEDAKGDLRHREKLPMGINSRLNDGAACFNEVGDEIFFTRNNRHRNKRDQLQIFTSHYNGREWSTPVVLPFVILGASYAHPSLSPDGNTLYFASDVTGSGYGGMDLYMSHRKDKGWETPVNLGKGINTMGNETFPFVANDGTLYFTSDGLPGYGGMDVFQANQVNGMYVNPENMGREFNSRRDDLSFIIDRKMPKGYFASNRGGDDDIYSFSIPDTKSEDKPIVATLNSGKVTDKVTGEPIAGARIEIASITNPTTGQFYYTNEAGMFYYPQLKNPNDEIKVYKDKYKTLSLPIMNTKEGESLPIALEMDNAPVAPIEYYKTVLYYEVNHSELTDHNMELLKPAVDALKANPKSTVYISGFADERGGDTYNFGLSVRRVKEALEYMANQGIDMYRIRSAYYGGIKIDAHCRQSAKCMNNALHENRRVEVKVGNGQ